MIPRPFATFVFGSILHVFVVVSCSRSVLADQPTKLPEKVSFNAHIRPIMSNTCFACHGPDDDNNPSGLRLDTFEMATEEAIVPGDAESSAVFQRITDSDDPMPPEKFRHQLSDYEKALFEKWIDQGAKYQQHWSWAPLVRPEAPKTEVATPGEDPKKRTSVIDQFIQRRLAIENLDPSPVADRRTLLRRLSLDLIGLPPTLEELEAFENDKSDDAWEQQVDRLLASRHYGERVASQWLDIVRFSDTVGFHGDQNQNNFAYRDYVIDAFNSNKPFDQFTIEQLAGDLLENYTQEQLVATGLVRLNMMTREGGAQPREYLAKYTADRVRMLGTAWLGATTGCCECHNHKYDPFTAKDFYSLGAYFDDLRQWGVYATHRYTPNRDLSGFNNDHPFPPELRFKSKTLTQQIAFLESYLETLTAQSKKSLAFNSEKVGSWFDATAKFLSVHPNGWMPILKIDVDSTHKESIKKVNEKDGSTLIAGRRIKDQVITVSADQSTPWPDAIRYLRLEVLPDAANRGYVGRARDGRFGISLSAQVTDADDPEASRDVEIECVQTDRETPKYTSGRPRLFTGDVWTSGPARWQLPTDEAKQPHTGIYRFKKAVSLSDNERLVVTLKSESVGKFRLSVSPLSRFVIGEKFFSSQFAAAIESRQANRDLNADQQRAVVSAMYWATTDSQNSPKYLIKVRDQIVVARSGYAMTTISQTIPDKQIKTARVLARGNWQDESGEEVLPATPAFLPGHVEYEQQTKLPRQTRLDLAKWLVSKENPLVARHYVNRTWKHFFGKGLSSKLDDLGNQGEWPSHPELLDWLAADFQENWDMKALARQIVTSHTYRQAAAVRSDLTDIDPYNRLLSQQTARRLEAEAVRDNALAISGLLESSFIGGPSVFPYQPNGHYSNIQFPNRSYTASPGPLQYRRGVYMHWQRSFLHPMLVNFDAPSRDECSADRPESNSPQQALTLLNDPSFVEAARALAVRIQNSSTDDTFESILDRGFMLAVGRSANESEQEGLQKVFGDQMAYYRSHPGEARQLSKNGNMKPSEDKSEKNRTEAQAQLAAWTQVCRVILNLHETITRY